MKSSYRSGLWRAAPAVVAIVVALIAPCVQAHRSPPGAGPSPAVLAASSGSCSGYLSESVPPSTIRVLEYAQHTSSGAPVAGSEIGVVVVPFETYVENVLPNEWISSWQVNSLRAGAVAAKSYAWYWVNHWRGGSFGGQCYDVDDSTNYQRFVPGSQKPQTTAAVLATWPVLAWRSGQVLEASYQATLTGSASEACGAGVPAGGGSILSQWGSQNCATAGLTWSQILTTYYAGLTLIVPPAHAPPVTSSSGVLARAVSDSQSEIAVRGLDNSLWEYWSIDGSTVWNSVEVAGPGSAFSTPELIRAGNDRFTVIAVEGPVNSLNEYWNLDGTSSWNGVGIAGPGTTYSAPSLAIAAKDTATELAVEGPVNSLNEYWKPDNSAVARPIGIAPPYTTFAAPALVRAVNDTATEFAVEGPVNSLNAYWKPDNNPVAAGIGIAAPGTNFASPAIARAGDGGTLFAVQGPVNSLNEYWKPDSNPVAIKIAVAPAGTNYASPAIVRGRSDTATFVTVQGPVNSLNEYWKPDLSNTWNPVGIAGTGTNYASPSIVRGFFDTGTEAVVRGPGNSLQAYWNYDGQSPWNSSQAAGSGTTDN